MEAVAPARVPGLVTTFAELLAPTSGRMTSIPWETAPLPDGVPLAVVWRDGTARVLVGVDTPWVGEVLHEVIHLTQWRQAPSAQHQAAQRWVRDLLSGNLGPVAAHPAWGSVSAVLTSHASPGTRRAFDRRLSAAMHDPMGWWAIASDWPGIELPGGPPRRSPHTRPPTVTEAVRASLPPALRRHNPGGAWWWLVGSEVAAHEHTRIACAGPTLLGRPGG
jgi:hypothetical protein